MADGFTRKASFPSQPFFNSSFVVRTTQAVEVNPRFSRE